AWLAYRGDVVRVVCSVSVASAARAACKVDSWAGCVGCYEPSRIRKIETAFDQTIPPCDELTRSDRCPDASSERAESIGVFDWSTWEAAHVATSLSSGPR